jgi:large subunit ribosomal protein L29
MAKKATAKATARKVHGGAFSQRQNKSAEKLRNLAETELVSKQRELSDQLFRLKFQMKMGQTESLKKIRDLRRDVARVKTIAHGRVLGLEPTGTEKK